MSPAPGADPALRGAVELLGRSLTYTCAALAGVDDAPGGNLTAPTPCRRWDLARLLAHMEDALDAFAEAAAGTVEVGVAPAAPSRVVALRVKASALLDTWVAASTTASTTGSTTRVDVGTTAGPASMAAPLLVATAALEVAVHGWDVHRATGSDTPLPDDLAVGLLELAHAVVGPGERPRRFDPPLASPGELTPAEQLLAFLGRVPEARTGAARFWERAGVRAAG